MTQVTAGGPGYVAVGWRGVTGEPQNPSDAAIWTSVDGSTWQLASASAGTFTEPDNQYVASVVATHTGLVAVGSETSNSASIWTSENGTEWRRVSNDGGIFGNDHGSCFRCPGVGDYVMANDVTVNPAGTKVVAVGQESRVGRAAIWVGR